MRKTSRFTLIEIVVSIFILILVMDLIFDFFIGARKNSQKNDDSFALSLAIESTLNQLDPKKYDVSQLEDLLKKEALANSFSKREISWKLQEKNKSIDLRFYRKGKQIFSTELLLP